MARFRNKPREIEATQWFPGADVPGVTAEESCATLHDKSGGSQTFRQPDRHYVTTIQGRKVYISPGEWVVTESDGEHHYPIAEAEFSRSYEPVS